MRRLVRTYTVGTDLLQTLEIVTELGVDTVGKDLRVLAIHNIALTIEEPGRNLVGGRGLENLDKAFKLLRLWHPLASFLSQL